MSELSELVAARMDQCGWSNRAVAAYSQDCPTGGISHTTVGYYRRGTHGPRSSDRVLAALSWALDMPLGELRQAAGMRELLGPWTPPVEAELLTGPERSALATLILVMVATKPVTSTALCDSREVEAPEVTHVSRVVDSPAGTGGRERSTPNRCH